MNPHHDCFHELLRIRDALIARHVYLDACEPYGSSALNMQDYISLKKHDLAPLQERLSELGLSSLGKSHFHILHTIERELELLAAASGLEFTPVNQSYIGYTQAYELLKERARFLKPGEERMSVPSVMLTLPSNAAEDPDFIANLERFGIDICRINTAHDTPETWRAMAEMIRGLNEGVRKDHPIRIYVDLAGPKFRTGSVRMQPMGFKIKPYRSERVRIVPRSGTLRSEAVPGMGPEAAITVTVVVEERFFQELWKAEALKISDVEGRRRRCEVLSWNPAECFVEAKGVRIDPQTRLYAVGKGKKRLEGVPVEFVMEHEQIRLFKGDRLRISNHDAEEGRCCAGEPRYKAVIACSGDDFLPFVAEGQIIFIDDGTIRLRVVEMLEDGVICEVLNTKPNGALLKPEKGINFPDSDINMDAVTSVDREHFEAVADFADIIGISFAQNPADIECLKEMLRARGRGDAGIIAKIETKKGVRNLPFLLLSLMPWPNSGIMLARGDLAIEVGFEKLPKVQSEVLDLCEAAHIPVIYATQILENMMKKNLPSRAEIIDASSAQRADCIMLNKGPFAAHAVDVLHYILEEMRQEVFKNKPLLHPTEAWKGFKERIAAEKL